VNRKALESHRGPPERRLFGVDPGVDPTQRPGGQLPLVAAGLVATLLPPLVQADAAEPSTMVAQMPIAAGTLVMMLASPLLQQPPPS
jgi:hypothetical protein